MSVSACFLLTLAAAVLALQPMPDGATEVSCRMHGLANFMNKLIGVCMDRDKMVGCDFEDGLQSVRQFAQGQAS